MRAAALALVTMALVTGAGSAAAQQTSLELSAGWSPDPQGTGRPGVSVAPRLAWEGGAAALRLHGRGTLFRDGGALGEAGAGGEWSLPLAGALSAALAAEGGVAGSRDGYAAASAVLAPALRLAGSGWGMAAGPWVARIARRSGTDSQPDRGLLPWGGAGSAAQSWSGATPRGVHAEAWGETGPLRLRAGWSHGRAAEARWSDWTGGAAGRLREAEVSAQAGWRTGGEGGAWAAARIVVPAGAGAGVVAEAGGYPADLRTGRAGGRFAALGLRLETGGRAAPPPPLRPRPTDGRVRLWLRARPGARVEVLGGWNHWSPIAAREVRPGEYVVEAVIAPGTHRFVVRVDGAERLPPGFATAPDDYGGRQAVVRVTR